MEVDCFAFARNDERERSLVLRRGSCGGALRRAHDVELRLLLVAERGVEGLQLRLDDFHGIDHGGQPGLDGIETRHRRLRH